MVTPSRPDLKDALRSAQLTESMRRLADALPFYSGSPEKLTDALVGVAGRNFHPDRVENREEIPEDIRDLSARIIQYAQDLPRSAALGEIMSEEALLDDFVWFLTQPLAIADRDVVRLEGRVLLELSRHEALGITNADFNTDKGSKRAIDMLNDFITQARTYPEEIAILRRRVNVLELIFVDPQNLALKMRNALHDINGMVMQLDGAAQMVIRYNDNDVLRARWLEGFRTIFNDRMDPFNYIKKAYPQLHVTTPKQELVIPDGQRDTLKRIMHSLMQNAINYGAQRVAISILARDARTTTIGIIDDGPGIPPEIQEQLGHRIIEHTSSKGDGSGWYIMKNHLVPEMGKGAAITFRSPIDEHGKDGTLIKLTIPLHPAPRTPAPPRGGKKPTRPRAADVIGADGPVGGDYTSNTSSNLAGAFGLIGGASVIPLTFPMMASKPIGKP